MEKLQEVITTLNATKDQILEQVKSVADKQNDSHEKAMEQIKSVEEALDEKIKNVEQQMKDVSCRIPGLEDENEAKNFSFQKVFKGLLTQDWTDAGFELEIKKHTDAFGEKRAAEVSGTTGVGFWIPTEISSDFVDLALASMPLYNVVTKLPNMSGKSFEIPVLLTRPDAVAVAESGNSSELDYTFGNRTFSAKRASGYTKISALTLRQTGTALESLIREQLGLSLRVKVHKGIVNGAGTSNDPLGVRGYRGSFTATDAIGTNGGRFTIAKASAMSSDLQEADHDFSGSNPGYLMRPVVMNGMQLERIPQYSGDTAGEFVFPPIVTKQRLENQVGAPIHLTTHLPNTNTKGSSTSCSDVIYGDWKQVFLAMWGGIELRTSQHASDASSNSAFLQHSVMLIVDQYYDVNIGDRTKFSHVPDAETTRSSW